MLILGIETTCDETGIAVVEDGKRIILSNIASSMGIQSKFGGVVPEVAAREQVSVIIPVFKRTGFDFERIDAIAVAYGPGLIGSLLIGVETAKALSFALEKPLIAVNHLAGHIFASWIENNKPPTFPLVALVVSGGHTDIVYMRSKNSIVLLGSTLDDAAGEAFDKAARVLGLGYPGGPAIEMEALKFNKTKTAIGFSQSLMESHGFDFSFSGIKTAVLNYVHKNMSFDRSEVAFAFQEAVCNVLVKKTITAALKKSAKNIVIGGGVIANNRLRNLFEEKCFCENLNVYFPEKKFSTDNGAMIAAAAFFSRKYSNPLKLEASPVLHY